MVNSEELVSAVEYLTLQTRCLYTEVVITGSGSTLNIFLKVLL